MAGRMPLAPVGKPYYDADRGLRMIRPRGSGKAVPYVGPTGGWSARRALRRTGVAGRDLAGSLVDDASRAGGTIATRSGNGGAILSFAITVAAGLMGLLFIQLLLSPRGSGAAVGLFNAAGGGIRRLLEPTDPLFGESARAQATTDRRQRATSAQPASSQGGSSTRRPASYVTPSSRGGVPGPTVAVAGRVFPLAPTAVAQRAKVWFSDSFGDSRKSGGMNDPTVHGAIDIMAPRGTPVVAIEDGTLDRVGWNTLGGYRLHVLGASGDWYYAHLDSYAAGVKAGKQVTAGEVIGYVGNTGQSGGVYHLHFAWQPPSSSTYSDPFSLLQGLWDALTKPAESIITKPNVVRV